MQNVVPRVSAGAASSADRGTYNAVIASNPAYSATLYARKLPILSFTLLISGVLLLLLFFLLPWFTVSGISSSHSYGGLAVATGAVNFGTASYDFPALWLFVLMGLALVAAGGFLFLHKVLSRGLGIVLRLIFLCALIVEIVYFISSLFSALSAVKAGNPSLATFPSMGMWFSILITIVAGIVILSLIPDLLWTWELAVNDLQRVERLNRIKRNVAAR